MEEAESVGLQQQAHRQQPSCTLDECFQLYTKEEQVGGTPGSGHPAPSREPPARVSLARGLVSAAALEGCGEAMGREVAVACDVPSWPRTTPGAARTARCPSRAR